MFGQVVVAYEGFPTFVTLIAFIVMMDSEVEPVQWTFWFSTKGQICEMESFLTVTSDIFYRTCRSCRDGNFGRRYCKDVASPHCGSSCVPSRLFCKEARGIFFFLIFYFKMQTALKLNTRNYGIWKKTYLSRTDFPQTKQVHFLLPPWVHSMCRFLFPVSLNCRPQISQGKGPWGEEEKAQWSPKWAGGQF